MHTLGHAVRSAVKQAPRSGLVGRATALSLRTTSFPMFFIAPCSSANFLVWLFLFVLDILDVRDMCHDRHFGKNVEAAGAAIADKHASGGRGVTSRCAVFFPGISAREERAYCIVGRLLLQHNHAVAGRGMVSAKFLCYVSMQGEGRRGRHPSPSAPALRSRAPRKWRWSLVEDSVEVQRVVVTGHRCVAVENDTTPERWGNGGPPAVHGLSTQLLNSIESWLTMRAVDVNTLALQFYPQRRVQSCQPVAIPRKNPAASPSVCG